MESSYKEALAYALKLLSRKDYTEAELKSKIVQKFSLREEEILLIINELKLSNYLNDLRTATSYYISKMEKGWGKRKIVWHLHQRGIKEEAITEVINSIPFDYSYIKREVEKKYNLKDKKERKRAERFLANRGFSYIEISNILKSQC